MKKTMKKTSVAPKLTARDRVTAMRGRYTLTPTVQKDIKKKGKVAKSLKGKKK